MGWDHECIIFNSLDEFEAWKHEIESQFVINNKGEKHYEYIGIYDQLSNEKYKLMYISHPDAGTDYSVLVTL